MNKSVLTISGGCGCGDGDGNLGNTPGGSGSSNNIIVRHKPGTINGNVIKEYNELGVKVYELDDLVFVDPLIQFTNDSEVAEIGSTIPEVVFEGLITPGTYPIASRTINPDPGGLNLAAAFNFSKLNVTRTTPGAAQLHTVTATDDQGNIASVSSKVDFKHAFYQGYSELAVLNETQIKALVNKTLNDSILQQYGGQRTYTIPGAPALPRYIYWVAPVGTPLISAATLSGFALPLVSLSNVDVVNIHDAGITTSYWVIRTANKFNPGNYSITIQ
jgi:hypothetical protein